ncbi:MAG: hypothetical protein NDI94_06140 [Candidatus Woesearchaeota archaeon]|nr:hypothetical protein [Candidatus Woesearchaeota archaeon]
MRRRILRDEREWLEKSTRPIDRFIPSAKKKLILKLTLVIAISLLIFIKFHKAFITLIAIVLISYIRFKRSKLRIDIEIEPTYLLAIALTLAFGIEYGITFIIIPTLATLIYGVSIGLLVNVINKIVVILATYFYWIATHNENYMILIATSLVFITDMSGFFIRKKFGQPMPQIIQVIATNTIIRFCYFSLFLDLVIRIIN